MNSKSIKKIFLVVLICMVLISFVGAENIEPLTSEVDDRYSEENSVDLEDNLSKDASEWAKYDIKNAYKNNLVELNLLNNYKSNITREEFGELVVILYEVLSQEEVSVLNKTVFKDTDNIKIVKAYELGIIKGITEKLFGPSYVISRQEAATMLYRTINKVGIDTTVKDYNIIFADEDDIDTWAKEAVAYLSYKDIVKGVGKNTFNPDGHITREQAIVLVNRILENFQQKESTRENSLYQDTSQYLKHVSTINLGKAYAGSSINISKFRQNAVLEVPEGRLVSFYDENGHVKIVLITDAGDKKELQIMPHISASLLGNGHASISMGYKSGEVHVIYGAHSTVPYFTRFNISKFKSNNQKVIEAKKWNETLTYPQFYVINDKLSLVYRNSGMKILTFDEGGNSWDQENTKLLFGNGEGNSVYIHDLAIRDHLVAIPHMFRLKNNHSDLVQNDRIYLVYSKDFGETYQDINGNPISLPVTKISTDKIVQIGVNDSLMNQDASTLSKDGMLYFTHMNKNQQGIPQVHITSIDMEEGKILTKEVSKNKVEFSLEGRGTLTLPLSRAEIAVSEDLIHVIYRQGDYMIIATAQRDEEGFPKGGWEYYSPQTGPLGVWEPNYDLEAWEEHQQLIIFVQEVHQGKGDKAVHNLSTDVLLYEFVKAY